MPVIRILHISDLHSRGPRDGADKWKRNLLLTAWMRDLPDVHDDEHPIDFVCFTGDIADFGLPEEYAATTEFIHSIVKALNLPANRVFIVPGNHDVNRKIRPDLWQALRAGTPAIRSQQLSSWLAGGKTPPGLSDDMRTAVLARQSAFWSWVGTDLGLPHLLPPASPHGILGYRSKLELPRCSFPIHIIGFDSAWLAGDDQDQGRLYLTSDQVGRLLHDDGKPLAGLRIGLIHHPLSDLADTKDWKQFFSDGLDLLLRGHLHSGAFIEEVEPRRRLKHIASGCLYEGHYDIQHPNSFNVIEIETDDDGQPLFIEVRFRSWSPESNHWFDDQSRYQGTQNGRYRWDCREVGEQVDTALELARGQDPELTITVLTECLKRLEPRMVHSDRMRVLRTLAPAHEALGDALAASKTYEQVASISRVPVDGDAFSALAHLHRKDHAEVVRLCEHVLATKPDHELALVVLIHAADATTPFDTLDARVPESLRKRGDILYALGWRAFCENDLEVSTKYLNLGLQHESGTYRFPELQACIALKKIERRQNNGLRAKLIPEELAELAQAEILLTSTLAERKDPVRRARVLYLRAEVFWKLDRIDDALDDFVAIVSSVGTVDLDHVERYLDLLMEQHRWPEAERVAGKYLKDRPSVQLALRLARARELREANATQIAEACRLLHETLAKAPVGAPGFLDAVFWLLRSDGSLPPEEVKELSSPLGDVLSQALYSQALSKQGKQAEALTLAKAAKGALQGTSPLEDLVHVARALAETALPDGQRAAISVWTAYLLPRSTPGPWLYQAFELARLVDDDRFTREVHQCLRKADLATPPIVEHEINYLMRIKAYDEALVAIDYGNSRYHDEPRFVWGLDLRRSILGVWLRRPELVKNDVAYLVGDHDYPLEVARQVHLVLRSIDRFAATEFAYQRVRRDRDNAGACSMLANSVGADASHVPTVEAVSEGAAVRLNIPNMAPVWVIVESGGAPSVTQNEYPLNHQLVQALLGHRLGDICQIPAPRGTTACTIEVLTSKYIYMRNAIWERWTTLFPEVPYAEQFEVPRDADGNLDIPGFYAFLDELNAGRPSPDELFSNPIMCASVLAKILDVTVLQAYGAFLDHPSGVLRQAPGTWTDFDATAAAIDSSTEFILDPLTIAILIDSDVLIKLDALAGRLAVAHATLDEYRAILLEEDEGESISVKKEGGAYQFIKRDPEKRREARTKIEAAIDWLERKCTVLGGTYVLDVPPDVHEKLNRIFPLSTVQTIAAAYATKRVLWTDDYAVPIVLEVKLSMRRAWTQVCLTRFRSLGLIDDSIYVAVIRHLLAAGSDSAEINADDFLAVAERCEWNPSKFGKWFRCVQTSRTPTPDLVQASASILYSATLKVAASAREEFVRGFLAALARRPSGSSILRELDLLLEIGRFNLNVVGESIVRTEIARMGKLGKTSTN